MKNRKMNLRFIISSAIISVMLLSSVFHMLEYKQNTVEASVQKKDTVDIRIIGTTDLHGQLNSKDYEKGIDYNNGGLARVYNLIQKLRAEVPKANSITLDAGDFLYDYTTEYIYSENQHAIQPIMMGMAMIGYDAITLGNHEFDYGYEYILRQLNGSGLRDITVVSNVTDSKTGEYPFLENMLITRKMKSSSGKEIEVKIGIIGQTIPTLTSKTHSYVGILKTEDMVENAEKQAAKLKEMGAHIIIALSHTGIGPEFPEKNFKNVAYALTRVPDIDVVVGGHEHNVYPTNVMTSAYFKLPNVDKKTFLMNGKNVIMSGDRGAAVGVVDLTLEFTEDSYQIISRKSDMREVTADIKEDKRIASLYGEWEEKLLRYTTNIIGELEPGTVIQNFYGLLGDNAAIQLLNDSKISFALKFANTTGSIYSGYPIVAASNYESFGALSIEDYVNIRDKITESHLSKLQPYNNYLYIYTINGKQLREWLEWSASAFETIIGNVEWKDRTMAALMKDTGLKSLIREEWLNDWNNFYIFDGIEYVINPRVEPRYDFSGNRIRATYRIQSMKYNGKEITDDMQLLIVTDKITRPSGANKGVELQAVSRGFNRSQANLGNYIEFVSKAGSMLPQIDYNWRVQMPDNYSFLVKTPNYAHELIRNTSWYVEYIREVDKYRYYKASYPRQGADTMAPHIVASPLKTGATGRPYDVAVQVTDASPLKAVKYLEGDYDVSSNAWAYASDVRATFRVTKNGIYTIYAEDIHGNKVVRRIMIDNFNSNLLAAPTVNAYTNRKTRISGRAEPGTSIVFEAYTGTYEDTVGPTGVFSYALPAQPSGTSVKVYVKDNERGLVGEQVSVTVRRTGPNQPSINPVNNNAGYLSGTLNDSDASVIVIIDDVVYVRDKTTKELYQKNTEIYNRNLKIVEGQIDVSDAGYFVMLLPPQKAGETITVYNLDHIGRNSRVNQIRVEEIAPNVPVLYDVSNIERTLIGYVPKLSSDSVYTINLYHEDKTYTTLTDRRGYFRFSIDEQLKVGQKLVVTASDMKNGASRTSYPAEIVVADIRDFIIADATELTLQAVTVDDFYIIGNYETTGVVYIAIAEGEGDNFSNTLYTVNTDLDGLIQFDMPQAIKPGDKIYLMARFVDGIILYVKETTVLPSIPKAPMLIKEITNADKQVLVAADPDCEITLSIGKKTYVSKVYSYQKETDQYIYTFSTDRDLSGTKVTISAKNITGVGETYTSKVVKAAPDAPEVNALKAGDTVVKGKIELVNYKAANNNSLPTPEIFANAPTKVAQTQTRVFVQIGTKIYEGTINNKGNYVVTVPKLKAGQSIRVWGSNKAGRGPLISVKVANK